MAIDGRNRDSSAGLEKRLGLIVNPIAGIGGRVGLKGSDGAEIQQKARAMGAESEAGERTRQALKQIRGLERVRIITYPGEMGADAAHACGFDPTIVGAIEPGETTAADTRAAAQEMRRLGVDLLLFAGGDGTARDIYNALGDRLPVLGIPAGVKIFSAVFGTNPLNAGALAREVLQDRIPGLRESEVMDIDEEAVRAGVVTAKLYGYLRVPFQRRLVQSLKAASSPGEQAAMEEIAVEIVEHMKDDVLYILGPGTTTRAITSELGLDKTLIGVDGIKNRELVIKDASEAQLLELAQRTRCKIIVTPIGGQGHIFGRGNQQISSRVIARVGPGNVIVVSTTSKLHGLSGRPLLVDTGDPELNQKLNGFIAVVTGYREEMMYRVSS